MAGWDKPSLRVHRAVNAGACPYEEVVIFFREEPSTDPQPVCPVNTSGEGANRGGALTAGGRLDASPVIGRAGAI